MQRESQQQNKNQTHILKVLYVNSNHVPFLWKALAMNFEKNVHLHATATLIFFHYNTVSKTTYRETQLNCGLF